MTRICLYGAPGTGKTTISQALQKRLNIELIEGDYLRRLAQKHTSTENDPFLYIGTTEAWKELTHLQIFNL